MRPLDSRKKRRFTLTAPMILNFAAERGFDLRGLNRGLQAVLRAERQLSPTVKIDIDPLMTLAFALSCAPRLVHEEWIIPLLKSLASKEPVPSSSNAQDDHHNAVTVLTRGRSAVAVHLPPRAKRPGDQLRAETDAASRAD